MGKQTWTLYVAEDVKATAEVVASAPSLAALSVAASAYAGWWSVVAVHDDGMNPASYWLLDGKSTNVRRGRWCWIAST